MRILFLIFCSIVLSASVFAQAPFCAGIKAEEFPMNPQSGAYNYFGVRVTLDQAYGEDVTISGTISADGNPSQPFTLTITAGNVTNETDVSFYQADPTAMASVSIGSVSPSTVTTGGSSFATGCSFDVIGNLNAVGQLHNDYQDYLLTHIVSLNMDLIDTTTLKSVIATKTEDFLEANGITGVPFELNFAKCDSNAWNYTVSGYSTEGTTILNQLKSYIAAYESTNPTTFFNNLYNLQSQAASLSDPMEVYTVGIPVTVAIYSFNYWKDNADDWMTVFAAQDSIRNASRSSFYRPGNFHDDEYSYFSMPSKDRTFKQTAIEYGGGYAQMDVFKKCKVNLYQLGGADVVGAVQGAVGGSVLGPGGALAGGVLTSSVSSLGNLTNQVIGCFVSWWPF